jgi:hypothetical protein
VPAVSTPASGEFKASISPDDGLIEYELSYSGLVGTVQQAHIHFGQPAVNGSIVIWLCQTATTCLRCAASGRPGTQECDSNASPPRSCHARGSSIA